jgi:hypothetical protein
LFCVVRLPIIIEADFPKEQNLRMMEKRRDTVEVFLSSDWGVLRMDADTRVHRLVLFSHANRRFQVGRSFARADGKHPGDTRLHRSLDDGVAVV